MTCWYMIRLVLLVIIALEAVVILLTYFLLIRKDNRSIKESHDASILKIFAALGNIVGSVMYNNQRTAAYFSLHGPYVNRDVFIKVVQFESYREARFIEALEFIPFISEINRSTFNSFCSQNINPECYIKQLKPNQTLALPIAPNIFSNFQNTQGHLPIVYLYLLSNDANLGIAQGIDLLAFNPAIGNAALDEAVKSDVFVSEKVTLLKKDSKNPFANSGIYSLTTANFTDGSLMGFSNVVLRVSTLIDAAIDTAGIARDSIDLIVFDVTDDGKEIIMFKESTDIKINSLLDARRRKYKPVFTRTTQTFNRKYTFLFKFNNDKSLRSKNIFTIIIALSVSFVLFNVILGFALKLMQTRRNTKKIRVLQQTTTNLLSYCQHELRNPLNVIKGFLTYHLNCLTLVESGKSGHLLGKERSIRDEIDDMKIALGSCAFMEHVINDILVVQKLEQKVMEFHPTNFDVNLMLTDVWRTFKQKLDENQNVKYVQHCDNNLSVDLDEFRLKQILVNLLSNAIKYTEQGMIQMSAKQSGNGLIICVKDTGVGIPKNKQHLVFKPHIEMRATDVQRFASIGLGLY